MIKASSLLSALAVAALPLSPCAGAIGDMWVDDLIVAEDISVLPLVYCTGGTQYGLWQEPLLYAAAKFNPLFNFPMLFHSIMCRLSDYCGADFDPDDHNKQQSEFPGCATAAERETAAKSPVPTIGVRDKAVSQLVPFFAAGGPTNVGIITIGPLMHAYGGSPLCVWPASNVVDVSDGPVTTPTVSGANPLRAGVGRGGCFDVAGWLSCTNWNDRPQGFHTAAHPMADLGAFFHETLSPHFDIDWSAKGIPVPEMSAYPESFFLTNSPNYLSSEAVPIAASNATLRTEPWRRSWEALGGLACVAWHTNTNVFEYEAVDAWSNGVLSVASSNAFVAGMTSYMNNGHPALSDSRYFPADGRGVMKNDYFGPQGWNGEDVRPNDPQYEPRYIFWRGPWSPSADIPVSQDLSFNWMHTNVNARVLSAPVSNASEKVEIAMKATSQKIWKFRKVNKQGGDMLSLTNGTAVADFGYGVHEYVFHSYVIGPTSYDWDLVEEGDPVTHVQFSAVSNFMQTALCASLTAESAWQGLYGAWYEDAGPMRLSTVCTYDDVFGTAYFVSGEGGKYGTRMDDFLYALVLGNAGYADADELSASAHPMPRAPQPACFGYEPSWIYGNWTGAGNDYTVRTYGPPLPFSSHGGFTNVAYTAEYSTTNEVGVVEDWRDIVNCDAEGNVISKSHTLQPEGTPEPEIIDGAGYIPDDEVEARSEITFTIDQRCDLRYRVEWTPVRAWGVLNNVTGTPDWPNPNEQH